MDLAKAEISVRQRTDRYGEIGNTKSHFSQRTLPVPPAVINTLREWKLRYPAGELVFPNGQGHPESHSNIINCGLIPADLPIETGKKDEDGEAVMAARYSGLHAPGTSMQAG